MSQEFETWLGEVNNELNSTNMRMEHWQDLIPFDFGEEFTAGTKQRDAALKAARYWRRENLIVDLGCSTHRRREIELQHWFSNSFLYELPSQFSCCALLRFDLEHHSGVCLSSECSCPVESAAWAEGHSD